MAKRPKYSEADFPEPGSVFVAPVGDGRWAAGRVLRRQFEGGAFAALVVSSRWIGSSIPALDEPGLLEPLVLTHHNWKGTPDIYWTFNPPPADFPIIGRIPPTDAELAIACNSFGGWQSTPLQALAQWRWDHDREALLRDEATKAAAETERRRQVAQARAEYLRTLTLRSLAERNWLETWTGEASSLRRAESQQVLTRLVDGLQSQPKLTKALARRLVKQAVESFNRLDAARPFIQTIEREDLCEALEQIVCAAGFPQLADDLDKWRTW